MLHYVPEVEFQDPQYIPNPRQPNYVANTLDPQYGAVSRAFPYEPLRHGPEYGADRRGPQRKVEHPMFQYSVQVRAPHGEDIPVALQYDGIPAPRYDDIRAPQFGTDPSALQYGVDVRAPQRLKTMTMTRTLGRSADSRGGASINNRS
ncbi:hypothetical protein BGX31_008974 [Mortierella sp. GBA43]|nr:hypothetical protein BGX31_008974 [Mortierella sp. GBA43]